ncbi:MAG: tetratricopeptide repeat protein [Nitrospirae bacterium]|nr:tetratricopeptide repeat protein [Nitrospirota bacterium]
MGESKKALEYYEKALKIDLNVYGENHPNVATEYNNMGNAWDIIGESKKALEYYEKALEILQKFYDDNHPRVRKIKNNINSIRNPKSQ